MITLPAIRQRSKTVTLGGAGFTTFREDFLLGDLAQTTKDDVTFMLRAIAKDEIAQQARLGNDPTLIVVDNSYARQLESAFRIVTAQFGNRLERMLLKVVEAELRKAILETTTVRTGKLSDIGSSWEWVYVPPGKRSASQSLKDGMVLPIGSRVVLRPKLEYVGVVNSYVKTSGSGYVTVRVRGGNGAKAKRSMGFMGLTARRVRSKAAFKNYAVRAGSTQRFRAAGDTSKYGTPFIEVVSMKRRGRYG